MKNENEYKDILHDLSWEPFYIHYHSGEQMHVYRSYCQSTSYPKIIIDATGSLIKNFKKFGMNKTKTIYLYEGLVYDESKLHSFTVSNMISERHTTLAIYNWLANWLNFNVPSPRETVCDQSMALLSACVKCFTQYSSLKQYIRVCAKLALGKLSPDPIWLPNCFIRTDVAHFIKLVSKWVPLKNTQGRVKEVILRTIGVIIKNQSISEIYSIVLSLFVVLTNESDGINAETGRDTPCEYHKKKIIEITSTGFVNYEEWYNEVFSTVDSEEEIRDFIEEDETQNIDLDNDKNPFQSWAEEIFEKSKEYIEEGNGINAMYLPKLVPLIIKCMHFLPLWSGLMIPIFKYGKLTASSAGVESSFKKLKIVTFKDMDLPTNIDLFLERHIISLRGNSLLRSSNYTHTSDNFQEVIPINQTNELHEDDFIQIDENNINDIIMDIENEIPIKKSITVNSNNCEENTAKEGWDRKSKRQRITNSYLNSNSHLRHIDLNNSRSMTSLPNLKNGSKVTDLKSRNLKDYGKVAISNTCAFDTLASIFMVAYCTSKRYSEEINCLDNTNEFLSFVSSIVKKGINPTTYKERAQIMLSYLEPEKTKIDYDITLVSCHATTAFVIKKLFVDIPTAFDYTLCSNPKCDYSTENKKPVTYITFHTENSLDGLQNFLLERLSIDYLTCGHINQYQTHPCSGDKTIRTEASTKHLFIEILKWEGTYSKYINKNITYNHYIQLFMLSYFLITGDITFYQDQSSEAAPQLKIPLKDIPQVLTYNNTTYELRGVCDYRKGLSRLRTSVGHYVAYCKRGPNNWELFDDTNKKSKAVSQNTEVLCELLIYTV